MYEQNCSCLLQCRIFIENLKILEMCSSIRSLIQYYKGVLASECLGQCLLVLKKTRFEKTCVIDMSINANNYTQRTNNLMTYVARCQIVVNISGTIRGISVTKINTSLFHKHFFIMDKKHKDSSCFSPEILNLQHHKQHTTQHHNSYRYNHTSQKFERSQSTSFSTQTER